MKLYADFYEADILVASPLALATLLSEGTGDPGVADFLSSIEVCVVDHADVVSMQNWTHLITGVLHICSPCYPIQAWATDAELLTLALILHA